MPPAQTGRYLRYKLAFDRLDEALEEGWLLEAISLEESIIFDRLISTLRRLGREPSAQQSLNNLINKAKMTFAENGDESYDSFFARLHEWRRNRNDCVHGFCKLDDHAYSESSAEVFSEKMWETAKTGRDLVDLTRNLSRLARIGDS